MNAPPCIRRLPALPAHLAVSVDPVPVAVALQRRGLLLDLDAIGKAGATVYKSLDFASVLGRLSRVQHTVVLCPRPSGSSWILDAPAEIRRGRWDME